jgi:hypothetical protein
MAQLKKITPFEEFWGEVPESYELWFYFDREITEEEQSEVYNALDGYYPSWCTNKSISLLVTLTDYLNLDGYMTMYIEKVKKEVPEILLEECGLIATVQEYELPEDS